MKKFVQISVLVLLVFAVAVTAFAAARTSPALAGGGSFCPYVGWNSRGAGCLAASPSPDPQRLAYSLLPNRRDVGWNS
jgi:hypothetical protein